MATDPCCEFALTFIITVILPLLQQKFKEFLQMEEKLRQHKAKVESTSNEIFEERLQKAMNFTRDAQVILSNMMQFVKHLKSIPVPRSGSREFPLSYSEQLFFFIDRTKIFEHFDPYKCTSPVDPKTRRAKPCSFCDVAKKMRDYMCSSVITVSGNVLVSCATFNHVYEKFAIVDDEHPDVSYICDEALFANIDSFPHIVPTRTRHKITTHRLYKSDDVASAIKALSPFISTISYKRNKADFDSFNQFINRNYYILPILPGDSNDAVRLINEYDQLFATRNKCTHCHSVECLYLKSAEPSVDRTAYSVAYSY
jgi:hypothetical protein